MFAGLRRRARLLKKDGLVLWFAWRDARTPTWLKLLMALLAAYAFSPIDLIPDFIPLLGLLDDAIIVPLGISLLVRLLPRDIRLSGEAQMERRQRQGRRWPAPILLLLLAFWLAALFWGFPHFMA
ncbi:DUF1232 domain-containing protein [Mixta tenebrionis]|uniref:DUF1232 domain-containing protein n=1 Tax=Mixta tenebrionis TaxID=2562439 RepID=A0A506VBN8_9GAMM|nr:DUF1232 domain-containing protein [Mixta tenebrionis]